MLFFFSFLLPVISFRFAPFCLSLFVGFWSLSVTLEAFLPSGGAWMLVLMKSQSPGQCPWARVRSVGCRVCHGGGGGGCWPWPWGTGGCLGAFSLGLVVSPQRILQTSSSGRAVEWGLGLWEPGCSALRVQQREGPWRGGSHPSLCSPRPHTLKGLGSHPSPERDLPLSARVRISTHLASLSSLRSVPQSCPTLCDPMDHSTPGLPVHHQLPKVTQTHAHRVGDATQPSHPLSSPSPPALNPLHHQGLRGLERKQERGWGGGPWRAPYAEFQTLTLWPLPSPCTTCGALSRLNLFEVPW